MQPVTLSAITPSNATILNLTYNFNAGNGTAGTGTDNGNVIQIANGKDGNRTQNFLYDPLNRIWQAYTNGANWGETYSPTAYAPGTSFSSSHAGIDAWGNLTNRSGVTGKTNSEALSCAGGTNNQLNTCFTYDAAGNLIQNGSATYTYDAENRLIAAAGISYVYDGDGNRIEKCTELVSNGVAKPGQCASNATGTFYWLHKDGGTLNESDLGGNFTAAYDLIRGQIAARIDKPGNVVHYYFHDHLGSTSIVTDASGNIQKESDYYPYGGEIVISNNDSNRYKFTGKERDSESGLDYFGARYNASSLGRMMTPDSGVDQHPEDPQSWNLYAYGRNNPLVMVDPTGEYVCGSGVTQTMCDNFQKELDAAQQGANALKDKYGADSTEYMDSQRSIDAYGKEGVDNGVTVQVGNVGSAGGTVDQNVGSVAPTADNPNGQKIAVTFGKEAFSGKADYTLDVAHEGSHVADASAWVSSGFSSMMNPWRRGTENRALHVEAYMAEGTNYGPVGFMLGNKPQYIWKPGWTRAMVDSAINWELNSPQGPYHLTPYSKLLAFKHNTKGGN